MKVVFVILHYITIDDTTQCIESILENVEYNNYSIVIVDNGSKNNTGNELKEQYRDNKKVTIIINDENVGFAKGNNIGFRYAKNQLNADFIILLNNDTVITQHEFIINLIESYKKNNFYICGPNIVSRVDKSKQNPIKKEFYSIKDVKKRIIKLYLLKILSIFNIDEKGQKLYFKIKKRKVIDKSVDKDKDFKLHGCCLVFSKLYISKYEGLYDKTFMYGEEDILKYISERDSLKMIYEKSINIFHKECSATYAYLEKPLRKRRFYYSNSINSYKELLQLMKSD